MTTRPWRGSVEVKFTRERSSRTTFTVEIVVPQTGQTAGYSSAYSASLSRTSWPSSRMRAAARGESLTLYLISDGRDATLAARPSASVGRPSVRARAAVVGARALRLPPALLRSGGALGRQGLGSEGIDDYGRLTFIARCGFVAPRGAGARSPGLPAAAHHERILALRCSSG